MQNQENEKKMGNSRVLKFRAWDKKENKMTLPFYIGDVAQGEGFFLHDFTDRERYEFLQYTGLHDKNGKEVYEGDILATFEDEDNPNYDGKPSKWIQVIRYDEERAQFIVTEEEVLTVLETTYEPQVADISLGYDEIEVIGNVYEKEKLIK